MNLPKTLAASRSLTWTERCCQQCFELTAGVAELTYVDRLTLYGPIWGCRACFDRLEAAGAAPELTGHILGDPAAFGRKR